MDEITKKELLAETGISYGQLYRWKREGLIPEEWFVKKSSFTGQETWFPREKILERIKFILEKKDDLSLEDIRSEITGVSGSEQDNLLREAVLAAKEAESAPAGAVLFETKDGKHFIVLSKGGKVYCDNGVKTLMVLTEKEIHEQTKTLLINEEKGGI